MRNTTLLDRLTIAAGQRSKEKDYWIKQLSGDLVKSIFPYDWQNKDQEKPHPLALPFKITGDLSAKLVKLSNLSDLRLHMILVAVLTILLDKYTSNRDIIVSMPIYKEDSNDEFINTVLAIRNRVKNNMTFKELILQVRETIQAAVEHQDYPMEILVKHLKIRTANNDFPLFDIVILLENIHDKGYLHRVRPNLVFTFARTAADIEGSVQYNSLLYRKLTIKRIITHFTYLLDQLLRDINIPISSAELLSREEKQQLLYDFNQSKTTGRQDKTIHRLFETQAAKKPDKIAVLDPGPAEMDRSSRSYSPKQAIHLTYKKLNEKANQLGRLLRNKGVKPGTIAAIMTGPSIPMIAGILGILKAGGAYLPLNDEYPEERVAAMLNHSDASIILTFSGIHKRFSFTRLQGLQNAMIEPQVTGLRQQCDFDSLPLPDRTLIDFEKYSRYIGHAMERKAVSIQGTRGCPYRCAYCHRTMQRKNVARSAENIFQEVRFYYQRGVRRFSFVDEIFNLNTENSTRFFKLILKNRLDVQLFFPNGMRADRLTKAYIDLMVEAGTVNLGLALETASPRLQKLIRKDMNIDKLRENAGYFCREYPNVILELFTMHGFPTETQEEAMQTLDFIKSLKWLHFPYVFLLKIHPSTDMMKLALDHGISREAIERSRTAAFHEIPETLPFPKSFTLGYVSQFIDEYFLCKERLLHVLPYQLKVASEDELARKYDNYLPVEIKNFSDLLVNAGITRQELGNPRDVRKDSDFVPDYQAIRKKRDPVKEKRADALRVLLLDLSVLFSSEGLNILHGEVTEPLGLLYLMTYLDKTFDTSVTGKIAKAKIDFDSFDQLKSLVCDFKPDLIGIRTLSYFQDFFHQTVSLIKEWGIEAAIIAGGPYGTSDYQLVLQDPNVDLTVLREGELTLAHLVEKMIENNKKLPGQEVLKNIKGIAFIKNKDKAKLKEKNRQILCLDRLPSPVSRYSVENPDNITAPGDLLYLISTSGSTGTPKSVMLEHRNLGNLLEFQYASSGIDFNRVLQFASIGFDVSAQEIFSTLLAGGTLFLLNSRLKHDIPELSGYIKRNCIDTLFLPPVFLKFIFSEPGNAAGFPATVKHIVTAGEQLVVTGPMRKYLKDNRVVLHNHYGPTETHVVSTLTIDPAGEIPERPLIGKPIANTRLYILDENRNLKPAGLAGELYISGHSVGRGYYRQEQPTRQRYLPDPFFAGERMYRTGDLARWVPDDRGEARMEFLGRVDLQVKIRGFRIEPGEIETRLLERTEIKDAVVIDRAGENQEKYLCAYIVSPQAVYPAELKAYLARSLPEYMIPAYFIQIETIPGTPNGKVDRKALPAPSGTTGTGSRYAPPTNEIEKKLAALWSEVLNIDKNSLGIIANFFDLGGHSLKATILTAKIHKVFNVKIPLVEVFKTPYIRDLARIIFDTRQIIFKEINPVEKKEYYPQSSAQKRLFFLDQFEKIGTSYNMATLFQVQGELDKKRCENAIKALIAHHETLRTSFHLIANEPVQRVHEEVEFAIRTLPLAELPGEEINRIQHFIRPFDLAAAPLLDVGLTRISPGKHLLFYNTHHITCDGTSISVLLEDFSRFYYNRELPPLVIQYKDFSSWQNQLFQKGAVKHQEKYWIDIYKGDIPRLDLPIDYRRPGIFTFEGASYAFKLGRADTLKFKNLGSPGGTTPFMKLIAAFYILLYKYSGQDDIVVGSSIAGRRHTGLQHLVGMFINELALRNQPQAEKTYLEFLNEVRITSIEAYENQDLQFEELVNRLDPERCPSRNPIFDVALVHQNFERTGVKFKGLKISLNNNEHKTSKFDMTLFSVENETGDEINFALEYYTRVFKPETIRQYARHFINIIKQVIRNPGVKIARIDILSEAEKKQVLEEYNRTSAGYPGDKTMDRLFAEQVRQSPDHIALLDESQPALHVTYQELNEKSNQLANYLAAGKKISTGKVIGLLLDNGPGIITAILGILKAGAAYMPIDTGLPEERIKTMIADARAGMVISGKKYIRTLNRLQWECSCFHTFLCLDSRNVHGEEEAEKNQLMEEKLWDYVAETSLDEITGGGWNSSFTGQPFSKQEMEEYGDNLLKKLNPLLHNHTRVLEIGCASGITMYRTAPRVAFYHSTDLSGKIIEKNIRQVKKLGYSNITLTHLPAHRIDEIRHNDFDLVIMNSVIQSFHGHNYLFNVIIKVIALLGSRGHIFIGDIMDLDLKNGLARDLEEFKQTHRDNGFTTKTDLSAELFVSKGFFKDLSREIPAIASLEFSRKRYTLENELTKYRYDLLVTIDKTRDPLRNKENPGKLKHQHDITALEHYAKVTPGIKISPNDPAYIIYTSGTTATPRGVIIEHKSLVNYAWWAKKAYLENNHRPQCAAFPLYTSLGFDLTVTSIYLPLLTGSTIVIYGKEHDRYTFPLERIIKEDRVEIIKATPSHLKILSPGIISKNRKVKTIIVGGEELESSLARDINRGFARAVDIYNEYGPTEATVGCMIYKYDEERDIERSVSIGLPAVNVSIYILDVSLNPVPVNAVGEIYIAGHGLARGYLNQPLLTKEKFIHPSPFTLLPSPLYKTGDLARRLPDGNIRFRGRIDEQVKIRGYRVELKEIENHLLAHSDIKDALVISRETPAAGDQSLCAYVVPHPEMKKDIEISALNDYLSRRLPGYMIPSYVVPVSRIPLTANGKPNKQALPPPQILGSSNTYSAPGNKTQITLARIWSQVLGIETDQISIDANFFEIGGHSLKATILVSKIHKELKIKLPLAEVFKTPTIRGQANYIKNLATTIPGIAHSRQNRYAGIEPVEKKEYYTLSSAQQRLYFLQQMDLNSTSYNMPLVLPLGKDLAIDQFELTLKKLLARHESLRTSFEQVKELPVQKIHPPDRIEFSMDYYEVDEAGAKEIIMNFIKPFDLTQAPLLRSGVIKLPGHQLTWLVDMHHITADGTSQTILAEDFITLDKGEKLEPLRIGYKDFSQWQERRFAGEEIDNQETYWLELYADARAIPHLDLPTDFKRPPVFTFKGNRCGFILEREAALQFKALGARHEGTLYMNILAALDTLFYKYTGQTDIIIGCGIAGRPHADLQEIVGMFVNSLAMRNYPQGEKTYESFLAEVIKQSVKAFENQEIQFEALVDKLAVERNPARNPLFDVEMVVQNFRKPGEGRKTKKNHDQASLAEQLPEPGKNNPAPGYYNPTAKFDLLFFIQEPGEEIHITLEYYTGIFKQETIKRLAHHMSNIIKTVVKEPGIKLKDIEMISRSEKNQLLEEWNNTVVPYPCDKTLHQLFEKQAAKNPDQSAIVSARQLTTGKEENMHLTYRELNRKADQLAYYLYQEKNIRSDHRVGILMDKSIDLITALLAILKAGGAYVPIEPSLPRERIKYMINDALVGTVISGKRYVNDLNCLQWECKDWHSYLCLDTSDIHGEDEFEQSGFMDKELWNHIGKSGSDDITGAGWISSYTGNPFSREEMDEYGDNILKKLKPLLNPKMKVLEIGCGSGITMFRLAPLVRLYHGTDLSPVIIAKNKQRREKEKHQNIKLACLAGHEIRQIQERNFDIIIINSVIQGFHGHNYLRKVINKATDLLGKKGYIFIGDVMDQEKKQALVRDLLAFKQDVTNKHNGYNTKTDFSGELFVPEGYWEDLGVECNVIQALEITPKIYTIENELTRYRYDVLFTINKEAPSSACTVKNRRKPGQATGSQVYEKRKYQHDLAALPGLGKEKVRLPVSSADLAYIIYTSGTTGKPKGVMIGHYSVVNLVFAQTRYFNINKKDRILQFSSVGFDASVEQIFMALANGACLVLTDKETLLDNHWFPLFTAKQSITHLHAVPVFFKHIHLEGNPQLKRIVAGGDVCPVSLADKLGRYRDFHNEYGPTETTVTSIEMKYSPGDIDESHPGLPIGKPIDNTFVYILHQDKQLVPPGAAGELYIGGDGLARGYLNQPQLTFEKFIEYKQIPQRNMSYKSHKSYIYRTGDLVRRQPDGNIEFLGRVDHQVKIRGYRIELQEIENHIIDFQTYHQPVNLLKKRLNEFNREVEIKAETSQVRCTRCLLTGHYPDTRFDCQGVCNHCREYETYHLKAKHYFNGFPDFKKLVEKARKERRSSTDDYDCLLLYSGGKDSTYVLYRLVELGLKVLAFTFDNGYISKTALENIERTTARLQTTSIIAAAKEMDKIFVHSLTHEDTVCGGCFKALTTLSTHLAYEKGINMVITGLSRGQIFDTRLQGLFRQGIFDITEIEEKLLLFRKMYHAIDEPTTRLLNIRLDDEVFRYIRFVDFFRYEGVTNKEIKEYLKHKDPYWTTPKDTGFCSTNCIINDVGIFAHKVKRGYHNYESPLSWECRLGSLNREDGYKELKVDVNIKEVERILKEIGYLENPVKDAVVTARQDGSGESELCVYFAAEAVIDTVELKDYLRKHLPGYMVPSSFVRLDKIPLTPSGKIDKKQLPAPGVTVGRDDTYAGPNDEIERRILGIWSEVLGISREKVSIDANFFDSGGHSLKATILAAKIRKQLDVELPLAQLFRAPTIRGLAAYIKKTPGKTYQTIHPVEKKQYYQLSHAQQRLWIMNQVEQEQTAYNVTLDLELKNLHRGAFEKTIHSLVKRHESLRTTFIKVNGEPQQKIHPPESADVKIDDIDMRNRDNREQHLKSTMETGMNAPFDLEKGPLLRMKLIRLQEEQHLFLLTLHHIISDAWSIGILVEEYRALYQTHGSEKPNTLTPLRIQYKDYSQWHTRQLAGKNVEEHQAYWINRFKGERPVLELPLDYPRPKVKSFAGGFIRFNLGKQLTRKLEHLSRENNTTLFVVYVALVDVFLYRSTDQTDIIVGAVTAGRDHKDLDEQIGFYVNLLPLRNQLTRGQGFKELLETVKGNTLEAITHQVYPFDLLIRDLGIKRESGRNPLFDVVVHGITTHQQPDSPAGTNGNTDIDTDTDHMFEMGIGTGKHDLRFRFDDQGSHIIVHIQYNPLLFKKDRILIMSEQLINLITAITANIDEKIEHIDLRVGPAKKKTKRQIKGEF